MKMSSGFSQHLALLAVNSFLEAILKHPNEIPKYFLENIKLKRPNYTWIVIKGDDGHYFNNKSIYITLTYNNLPMFNNFDNGDITYTLFGIGK